MLKFSYGQLDNQIFMQALMRVYAQGVLPFLCAKEFKELIAVFRDESRKAGELFKEKVAPLEGEERNRAIKELLALTFDVKKPAFTWATFRNLEGLQLTGVEMELLDQLFSKACKSEPTPEVQPEPPATA